MLDTVDVQFQERFAQADLEVLERLEHTLLTGVMDDIVGQYPELNRHSLEVQLNMFHSKYTCKSTDEVVTLLRKMATERQNEVLALSGVSKHTHSLSLCLPLSLLLSPSSLSPLSRTVVVIIVIVVAAVVVVIVVVIVVVVIVVVVVVESERKERQIKRERKKRRRQRRKFEKKVEMRKKRERGFNGSLPSSSEASHVAMVTCLISCCSQAWPAQRTSKVYRADHGGGVNEGAFQLSCTWSSLLLRPPSGGGVVSLVDLTGPLGWPRLGTAADKTSHLGDVRRL
ncbi:hypothetical protein WMY93_019007 [Mugilogobius chulae]|uniref:Uncharacterized protein n=1 Tax=Mugilogobius chulae TaxID=88201 RepID=A0AAW0NH78_9GOBI